MHSQNIPKAELGTIAKIQEELSEAIDAEGQGLDLLVLIELSDIVGAVEAYAKKKYNFSLDQLLLFARWKSGTRLASALKSIEEVAKDGSAFPSVFRDRGAEYSG
jgi:hypothetical protein